MGEVRIISAPESAKVKGGHELPKPPALIVVHWIGFIWVVVGIVRMFWLLVDLRFIESFAMIGALTMFLIPFLAMCFGMKRSRYFIPVFCTCGAMAAFEAMGQNLIPIALMGFVPSIAIWTCSSIRKWYDSLV